MKNSKFFSFVLNLFICKSNNRFHRKKNQFIKIICYMRDITKKNITFNEKSLRRDIKAAKLKG